MELSEKLIALRKSKGLSQLELAEALNVSRQAISRWEVGTVTPSAENLKCLSEFYEISIDELLDIAVSSRQEKGEEEPATESIKDANEDNSNYGLIDECGGLGSSKDTKNLEDVLVLRRDGLGRLFVVVAIIWAVVLILGFGGHATLAAELFILLSGILLLAGCIGYVLVKYFWRK